MGSVQSQNTDNAKSKGRDAKDNAPAAASVPDLKVFVSSNGEAILEIVARIEAIEKKLGIK